MLLSLGGKRVIVVSNVPDFPVAPAQPALLFTEEFCSITADRETLTIQVHCALDCFLLSV